MGKRLCRTAVWGALLALVVVLGGLAPTSHAARPASFDAFETVGLANDPEVAQVLILDATTINNINCGCDDCGPGMCTDPTDTYYYFPTWLNQFGDPKPYWLTAGEIQIDRTTDLFLAGADQFYTKLRIRDQDFTPAGPAAPAFTVIDAPLINVANFQFWLDPGYKESNDYPDGPIAIEFANTSSVDFELLNTFFQASKVKIGGPGDYRLQNVTVQTIGSLDTFLEVDDAGAEVTIVGGLFGSGGAYHPELLGSKIVTTCLSVDQPAPGNPAECACGTDGCGAAELQALEDLCDAPGAPEGCPYNPCGCENYFVWQREGRVRLFSTALIQINGEADVRIDSAAPSPHAMVNVRSEGTKCTTGYPSTHLLVPPTTDAVDVLMLNNVGAWVHGLTRCPPRHEQLGDGHFVDYSGAGTVWLLHNTGPLGVSALAVGTAPQATIVAAGNRFLGNNGDDGTDPTNLLPMNPGTCAVSGGPCYGGDPEACPGKDACTAPPIELITAGNQWSRGDFCDWCEQQADPSLCDAPCDGWLFGDQPFVDEAEAFTDYASVPEVPDVPIPFPITLPPVNAPLDRMVDAKAECKTNLCTDYYPNTCSYCIGNNCSVGIYPHTDPTCWIQAGIYKAIDEGKPVYIAEGTYTIPRPLYWVHKDQEWQDIPLPPGLKYLGGWIVGQNNNVTIKNSDPEPVFTSQGLSFATIQGITFETAPYSGTETHSTMDIENNKWTCGLDPTLVCGNANDCNVCENSTCRSNPGQSCTTSADCTDTCNEEQVGRQTATIGMYDCNFKGGRHALGLCINSSNQCDTIMTVNGTFSDAHIGWANGGWNALHNIAYRPTLTDNEIAMGQDDEFISSGQGDWSALHATISSSISGARDINLFGGNNAYYFYNVFSDNTVVLDETLTQNRSYAIVFDHSTLNHDNPPLTTPMIDYKQGYGPMFLRTDLGEGWIRFGDAGLSIKGRAAWKIQSEAPGWPNNVLSNENPDTNPGQTSKFFELEFCREADPCAPCGRSSYCFERDTGDTQCLDPDTSQWTVSSCGETLVYEECMCRTLSRRQTCPLLGDDGVFDGCP